MPSPGSGRLIRCGQRLMPIRGCLRQVPTFTRTKRSVPARPVWRTFDLLTTPISVWDPRRPSGSTSSYTIPTEAQVASPFRPRAEPSGSLRFAKQRRLQGQDTVRHPWRARLRQGADRCLCPLLKVAWVMQQRCHNLPGAANSPESSSTRAARDGATFVPLVACFVESSLGNLVIYIRNFTTLLSECRHPRNARSRA
jgi:hypothetical protein